MRATAILLTYPPARYIGAELATHALLRHLQTHGWDVRVLLHTPPTAAVYQGVPLRPLRQITAFTVTEGGYPDKYDNILLTHSYISPQLLTPLLDARQRYGTPVVIYAHSARDHTRKAIQIINPDFIIPNSHTTARELDLPLHTAVRPPLQIPTATLLTARITAAPRPKVAGYVNSTLIKGGQLLGELTARISELPYVIYGIDGGYGDQLAPAHPPVRHGDMPAEYYQKIGIHLQLSRSESYGLTALEALSYGVPVISTDLPGPREALYRVPSRFIRWVPPDITATDLDIQIRALFSLHPPTVKDIRQLASAVRRTALAAAVDRRLMEQFLRRAYG